MPRLRGSHIARSPATLSDKHRLFWNSFRIPGPPPPTAQSNVYAIPSENTQGPQHLQRPIHTLSAISSGVKDVREIINRVEQGGMFQQRGTILFIDEIHRFSKAQQDSLLGAVEKGTITLIGATTENPSFEVISALLSRCQVYTLQNHTKEDLIKLLDRAIKEDLVLKEKNIILEETNALLAISGGDARKLLNVFEIIILITIITGK